MSTIKTAKAVNAAFYNMVEQGRIKEAADAASEYTRQYMREEAFVDKLLPPVLIGNDELDRQVDTDKPVVIVDKEPNSPAAITVPFGQLPVNRYIRGPRYRVLFERIHSTRFTKDVDELRTYDMDVRQVLSDSSVKQMAAEKDSKFIAVVNAIVGNALYATITAADSGNGLGAGTPTNMGSGKSRNYILIDANGISRETLTEMLKIMPATASKLETQTVLCNMITIKDVLKFSRDEMGGDLAEEVLLNGWTERTFLGCRWIVTIKRELVANGEFYLFSEPKYMGKHFMLEDVTMWLKREAFYIEFFSYMTAGLAIGNVNACAKCKIVRSA
jgi:hypothetical protein